MTLPELNAEFAAIKELPKKMILAKWLAQMQGGNIGDYCMLHENQLYAKIAAAYGGRSEADYNSLPKNYAWDGIYNSVISTRYPAPAELSYVATNSTSLVLSWVDLGDGTIPFSVERATPSTPWTVISTTAVGATSFTDTGLSIGETYYYRVRGVVGSYFTYYAHTIEARTYDANAMAFVTTSGATDVVSINNFVLGVKALGLWNSIVCWPLRSAQNAGTGTTAYSLGGLGTYNSTLVNGPAWSGAGIVASATNHTITSGGYIPTRFHSLFYVKQVGSLPLSTNWSRNIFNNGANATLAFGLTHDTLLTYDTPQTNRIQGTFNPSLNTPFMLAGSAASSGSRVYANNNLIASNSITPPAITTPPAYNLFFTGSATVNHTIAFAAIANVGVSASQVSEFYNLYKSTLGTGLGLP